MSIQTRQVTLELPVEMVERALEAAERKGAPVEEILSAILSSEISRRDSVRQRWQQLAAEYTDELDRSGTHPRTRESIQDDARRVREEVASDSYP